MRSFRLIIDAPFAVESFYHQLQSVNVGDIEVLIDTEDVTKE